MKQMKHLFLSKLFIKVRKVLEVLVHIIQNNLIFGIKFRGLSIFQIKIPYHQGFLEFISLFHFKSIVFHAYQVKW